MRQSHLSLRLFLASTFALAGVVGCSDDDTTGGGYATGPGGGGGAAAAAIEVRFELPESGPPPFLDVPFPSFAYMAGGRVGDVPGMDAFIPKNAEQIVAGLSVLDGFGTSAGTIFRIDDNESAKGEDGLPAFGKVDVATLPATEKDSVDPASTVMLVDLEATTPDEALVPARVAFRDDTKLGGEFRPLLTVYPGRGIVLREGRKYAAVVTTGVAVEGGKPVEASTTLRAVLDGSRRSTDVEKSYGEAVDKVGELTGIDRAKIAGVATYTTARTKDELIELRSQIAAAPPPALSWDAADLAPMGAALFANDPLPAGFTATLDAWLGAPAKLMDGTDDPAHDQMTGEAHDAIAAVGTAVFEAPNFLQKSDDLYDDPKHGTFARDASGKVIPDADKPTSKIWVTIVLPEGVVPATGFPTVIVQHGLGGDRSYILSLANTFAKLGWATVGIESVTFGARGSLASFTVDELSAFPWSMTAGNYAGPDGFVDKRTGPNDFFGILKNFGAIRDQMRQSVLDLGVLAEILSDPALDLGPLATAVPNARLDGTRLAYVGDSLGGIMGAIHAAIDPRVRTYVLNVAGAGLLTELSNGPYIGDFIKLSGQVNFAITNARFAPGHALMQLFQHGVGPGDPLTWAEHVIQSPVTIDGTPNPRKNVLQIEVLYDELVCNESNEALAAAAGFALAEPSAGALSGVALAKAEARGGFIQGTPTSDVTAVVVQSSPAIHGSNLVRAKGTHQYETPWPRFDEEEPFPKLPAEITLDQPYLPLQSIATGFLGDWFAGMVPRVATFPAPTLDFDGDGAIDEGDADPNDPAKK